MLALGAGDVEVKAIPFGHLLALGDVPRPDLVWCETALADWLSIQGSV